MWRCWHEHELAHFDRTNVADFCWDVTSNMLHRVYCILPLGDSSFRSPDSWIALFNVALWGRAVAIFKWTLLPCCTWRATAFKCTYCAVRIASEYPFNIILGLLYPFMTATTTTTLKVYNCLASFIHASMLQSNFKIYCVEGQQTCHLKCVLVALLFLLYTFHCPSRPFFSSVLFSDSYWVQLNRHRSAGKMASAAVWTLGTLLPDITCLESKFTFLFYQGETWWDWKFVRKERHWCGHPCRTTKDHAHLRRLQIRTCSPGPI